MNQEFSTTFKLDDKISSPLERIIKLCEEMDDALESAQGGLKELEDSDLGSLNKSLNSVTGGLGELESATGDAASSLSQLESTSLGSLRKELSSVESAMGRVGSEAVGTKSDLKKIDGVSMSGVRGEADKVTSELGDLGKEAKSAKGELEGIGDTDLSGVLDGLTGALDLSNFLNVTELAKNATDAVMELGQASLEASERTTDAVNNIKIGLGATEEETKGLYDVAQNVFTGGYGESIDSVTGQLVYMKQVLGDISNADLEALLPQFITLEQQGMDFDETLRGVSNLATSFGISFQEATDLIAAGFQNGLDQSHELGDNIAEYAPRWADAGFSASQYFSLLQAGVDSGAYSLDRVGDFLNEFKTSLIDGRMESALGSLSSGTQQVFAAYQNNGATAQQVLDAVIGDMQNMTSETDKAALASTLWSSLGEDNSLKVIESLGGVQDSYSNVGGTAQQMAADNTNAVAQLQAKWSQMKDNALSPVGEFLATIGLNALTAVEQMAGGFGDFFSGLGQGFTDGITWLQDFGSNVGGTFNWIKDNALTWGSDLINGFLGGLRSGYDSVMTWFSDTFGGIVGKVKEIFGIASPSTVFSDIGTNLLQGFWNGMQGMWDSVSGWAQNAWSSITSIFSGGETTVDYSQTISDTQAQLSTLEQTANDTLTRISGNVASTVMGIAGAVPQAVATIPASLAQIFTTAQGVLTTQAGVLSQSFITGFAASFAASGAQLTPVVQGVFTSLITPVFTTLTTQTGQAVTALSTTTATQVAALAGTVSAQVAGLGGNVILTFGTMAATVPAQMGAITNALTSQNAVLVSNFGASFAAIESETVSTFNSTASQVTAINDALVTSLSNKIGTLRSVFGSAARSAMDALKAGIADKIGEVTNKASEVVQKLKQTFESGLGVASPSKYMTWIGQMMLLGLMKGLSGDKLQSFITSTIGDMQTAFENGKFDANSTVNFLSDQGTLDLIGRITKMDLGGAKSESVAYPLIGTMGTISSWFGNRPASDTGGIGSTNHGGIDIAASSGTPIAAAIGGTVTTASMSDGYGNLVVIDSGNGLETFYGHMSEIQTALGQTVTKGQQIGLVGSTGNSTGPHLHFEMRQNDNKIDPYPYLQGAQVSAGNTLASVIQNAYNLKHGIGTGTQQMANGNISYDVSAGAAQWTDLILQALQMLGQPSSLLGPVLATLNKESSGNPNAINDWDSNAAAGTPSKGLMQVIDPTFATYALPGYNTNIWDPLSNILASLNYQLHTYGGIEAHLNGYAVGTRYVPQDMLAMIHEGEAIIPASQNPYRDSGGDYLEGIGQRIVDGSGVIDTYPVSTTSSSQSVVIGDIHTTVNVNGATAADPQVIAATVSDQIMRDLKAAMTTKTGVKHGY